MVISSGGCSYLPSEKKITIKAIEAYMFSSSVQTDTHPDTFI